MIEIDAEAFTVYYLKEYERWCTEPAFDEETKKELLEIKGNDEEIKDRFYKELL